METIVAIVLAAGASTRLGRPKQLIEIQGKTMLTHLIEKINQAGFSNIMVVLGSNHQKIFDTVSNLPAHFIVNEQWEKGMGNSFSFGLRKSMIKWPDMSQVLVSVCDQPFVPVSHFEAIKNKISRDTSLIVASGYGGTFGPPLACGKKYFDEIIQLEGEKGAKSIFRKYQEQIEIIPCAECARDIDTPEDARIFSNH